MNRKKIEDTKEHFVLGNLSSICTKVMDSAPSPWNIDSKILDEITRLWMKTKLIWICDMC